MGRLDLDKAISGGHIGSKRNETPNAIGGKHITYADDKGNRLSYDTNSKGEVSKVHTTRPDHKHTNYDTKK